RQRMSISPISRKRLVLALVAKHLAVPLDHHGAATTGGSADGRPGIEDGPAAIFGGAFESIKRNTRLILDAVSLGDKAPTSSAIGVGPWIFTHAVLGWRRVQTLAGGSVKDSRRNVSAAGEK